MPASGHVDRAEAAVRGVVDGAELLRPPARQRLRLIAAREERELVGIALADVREPLGRERQRLVPFDLAEFARGRVRRRASSGFVSRAGE